MHVRLIEVARRLTAKTRTIHHWDVPGGVQPRPAPLASLREDPSGRGQTQIRTYVRTYVRRQLGTMRIFLMLRTSRYVCGTPTKGAVAFPPSHVPDVAHHVVAILTL